MFQWDNDHQFLYSDYHQEIYSLHKHCYKEKHFLFEIERKRERVVIL